MEHFKKYWWAYLLLLLAIIAVFNYKRLQTFFSSTEKKVKIGAGSAPTQADINCASGGAASSNQRMIVGSCTKPKIYPLPPNWKEKCFTSDELGLNEGETGYATVTDNNGLGTKWYFNYQSGDRFCYVNQPV